MKNAVFVVLLAWFGASMAAAENAKNLELVIDDLSRGGMVILMRHANSPSGQVAPVGLTADCDLEAGRGLDSTGFFQARFIGEFFASIEAPIGAVFTGGACRAWDTSRLVAPRAAVEVAPAFASTDQSQIDAIKLKAAQRLSDRPHENVLIVADADVVPLFAPWDQAGEIPSGVILLVDPADWSVKNTLDLDLNIAVE